MLSSLVRLQKFKSRTEQEKIESKPLVLDVETSWNSTYLLLEWALKFQKVFELLESVDVKYVKELCSKKGLSKLISNMLKYLIHFPKVFYETILICLVHFMPWEISTISKFMVLG